LYRRSPVCSNSVRTVTINIDIACYGRKPWIVFINFPVCRFKPVVADEVYQFTFLISSNSAGEKITGLLDRINKRLIQLIGHIAKLFPVILDTFADNTMRLLPVVNVRDLTAPVGFTRHILIG
jgi:hypothetical protein